MLRGRRFAQWQSKRRKETGWQDPCPTVGCARERALGLSTCVRCWHESRALTVHQEVRADEPVSA